MRVLIIIMIAVLLISAFFMLSLLIKGDSIYDKLNGLSYISADGLIILVLYGFLDGRPEMYIDIAIALAVLGFITNLTISKYLESRQKKDAE